MSIDTNTFSGYSVKNLDECKAFYETALGIEVTKDWMGIQLKLKSRQTVFLYQKDDHEAATFTVLNFIVESIDETVDELTKRGVVFEKYDSMPGGQDEKGVMRGKAADQGPDIAWFKDPSGNILSILEN